MVRKSFDLLIALFWSAAAYFASRTDGTAPLLRTLLTLPIVVFLPGYTLVAAIFPRHLPRLTERLLMALAVSLSVTAVTGLLLNWISYGISKTGWLTILPAVIWIAGVVALIRRSQVGIGSAIPRFRPTYVLRALALTSLILFFSVLALGLARNGESIGPAQPFSVLTAQRADQKVQVSIYNEEQSATQYHLKLLLNGSPYQDTGTFTLDKGNTNTVSITLAERTSGKLEALLYVGPQEDTPYRSVTLWLP